mgnify:CR=1 FL=1
MHDRLTTEAHGLRIGERPARKIQIDLWSEADGGRQEDVGLQVGEGNENPHGLHYGFSELGIIDHALSNSMIFDKNNYFIIGNEDPYFDESQFFEINKTYSNIGFNTIQYTGNHSIDKLQLNKLLNKILLFISFYNFL